MAVAVTVLLHFALPTFLGAPIVDVPIVMAIRTYNLSA